MTDEVQVWLEYADRDWNSAGQIFKMTNVPTGIVMFLCQQCVEKMLKAAMMQRSEFPPKTHNLSSLSNRLNKLDPGWQWSESELDRLTKGAVDYRYPGSLPSLATAQSAYLETGKIRTALLALITAADMTSPPNTPSAESTSDPR